MALHEVTWCMVVWCTQNLRRGRSSFMWHQPCQRCKYTASVDIQKHAIKSYSHSRRIKCERIESARERKIALYRSSHHNHLHQRTPVVWTSLPLNTHLSSPLPSSGLRWQYYLESCFYWLILLLKFLSMNQVHIWP